MKKIRVLLILLLLNLVSFGQSSLIISYGENIKIKKVEESTTFTIVVANENIILKGKEINNYKFIY